VMYVEISLSENIQSFSLSDRTVLYLVEISGTNTQFFSESKANLEGTLPVQSGTYLIKVEALENSVKFSEFTG